MTTIPPSKKELPAHMWLLALEPHEASRSVRMRPDGTVDYEVRVAPRKGAFMREKEPASDQNEAR